MLFLSSSLLTGLLLLKVHRNINMKNCSDVRFDSQFPSLTNFLHLLFPVKTSALQNYLFRWLNFEDLDCWFNSWWLYSPSSSPHSSWLDHGPYFFVEVLHNFHFLQPFLLCSLIKSSVLIDFINSRTPPASWLTSSSLKMVGIERCLPHPIFFRNHKWPSSDVHSYSWIYSSNNGISLIFPTIHCIFFLSLPHSPLRRQWFLKLNGVAEKMQSMRRVYIKIYTFHSLTIDLSDSCISQVNSLQLVCHSKQYFFIMRCKR